MIKAGRTRWTGHTASMVEKHMQGFVGKSEEKIPFGRPRGRWEDNIKTHVREVRGMTVDLIHLTQDTDK